MIQALLELLDIRLAGAYYGESLISEPLEPRGGEGLHSTAGGVGDAEARRLLIEHNLRLVAHIAKEVPRRRGTRTTLYP